MVRGVPPFPFVRESFNKLQQYADVLVASKYPANHTLMIGDALGDHQAAVANHVLFFPINPGAEEISWERLYEEGIDRFLAGTFAGDYQKELLAEFDRYLPSHPPWKVET
jgi:hypothetical protein